MQQRFRSFERAGDGVADADGCGRRWRLVLLHDVEMGIESRDLVYSCLRQGHFLAKRPQVPCREIVIAILDQMQELDEEIRATRPGAEQFAHLPKRSVI